MDNSLMTFDQNNTIENINEGTLNRKRFSKTSIGLGILTVIVCIICVMLFNKINSLESDLTQLKMDMFGTHDEAALGYGSPVLNTERNTITSAGMEKVSFYEMAKETNVNLNDSNEVVAADPYEGMIKVCFTFDDGPSANTDNILNVLDDYGVKATFFVNGKEGYDDQYKRIVEEGHAIGMHSYTHNYRDVYGSLDMFAEDLYNIQHLIKEKTGVESLLYRFPGGSSNTVSGTPMEKCIEYLDAKGIEYYDWNVASCDAVVGGLSTAQIVSNVMTPISAGGSDTYIILFHDAQDKNTTVEALPIIIEKLAAMDNVAIVPIDEYVTPVQHVVIQN